VKRARVVLDGQTLQAAAKCFRNDASFSQELSVMAKLMSKPETGQAVVRLLAKCSEKRILFYELMPAGDLEAIFLKITAE